MRKYRSAYLKPYIRRKTKNDIDYKGCDSRTYVRLCLPWFKYVVVQRGTNHIIGCGRSKQELKRDMSKRDNKRFGYNRKFSKWSNEVKKWQQEISIKIRKGRVRNENS